MKHRIHIITLGVRDLERATAFYRDGLSLPMHRQEDAGISFFALEGTWLALFPREELAADASVPASGSDFSGVTLGCLVESPAAVDSLLKRAAAAGATITQPGVRRPWGGYSGYFSDPDGHLWEIAWMEKPLPIDAASADEAAERGEPSASTTGSLGERSAPLVTEILVPRLDPTIASLTRLGFDLERRANGFAVLRWAGAYLFLSEESDRAQKNTAMHVRVAVPDVDAVLKVVAEAGAHVLEPIRNRDYGLRDFTVEIPGGLQIRFAEIIGGDE